jgi:hypothetical protein
MACANPPSTPMAYKDAFASLYAGIIILSLWVRVHDNAGVLDARLKAKWVR